ncbi:MAG: GGDEF domain-containing protein [Trueperaceae bacterium]
MARRPNLPRTQSTNPLVLLSAILLVPLVALLDFLSGPDLGFSLFYLVPIVIVARIGSRLSAWFAAIVGTLAWMVIDVLTTPGYTGVLIPLWNTLTRFAFFTLALVAVRRNHEQLQSARVMALSDPLTGLPNREYLLIMLNAASARLERYGAPLTLAYLDVDDFKRVNDQHGHMAGDRLLQRIAGVLLDEVRDTDTVARVGGDEFLILLPDADILAVRAVLERVHQALKAITDRDSTRVTFSIGACMFQRPFESVEAMLRESDERMYRVKHSGKDSITIDEVG